MNKQAGAVQFIVLIVLLLGIAGAIYLVTSGNPLKLFSKATQQPPIVFTKLDGSALNKVDEVTIYPGVATGAVSTSVRVELTSTLGSANVSSPSAFGKAIRFANTDGKGSNRIEVFNQDVFGLNQLNKITVETWVKPNPHSDGLVVLKSKSSGNNLSDYQYYMSVRNNDNAIFCVRINTAAGQMCASTALGTSYQNSGWYHLAMVFDQGVFKTFINGKRTGAQTIAGALLDNSLTGTLYIGGTPDHISALNTDYKGFNGDIDEMRFSNNARYNEDFTPSTKPFIDDANTLALWHYDGNFADDVNRKSGQTIGQVDFINSTLGVSSPSSSGQRYTRSYKVVDDPSQFANARSEVYTSDPVVFPRLFKTNLQSCGSDQKSLWTEFEANDGTKDRVSAAIKFENTCTAESPFKSAVRFAPGVSPKPYITANVSKPVIFGGISVYIKPDKSLNTSPNGVVVFSREVTGTGSGVRLWILNGTPLLTITDKLADGTIKAQSILGQTVIEPDKWHYIAVINKNNKLTMYVNGALQIDQSIKQSEIALTAIHDPADNKFIIGCFKTVSNSQCFGNEFIGEIDELMVTSSSSLVSEKDPKVPYSTAGDILHYHFDGDLKDSSPNHFDGTAVNKVEFVKSTVSTTADASVSKSLICENYGDLDLDGKISQKDVDIMSQISKGTLVANTSGKEYMLVVGDVDDTTVVDKKVDDNDVRIVQEYLDGKSNTFPVCANLKPTPCGALGDVTGDGKISKIDAQEVLNIVVGNPNSIYTGKPYTEAQKKNADVDLESLSNGERVTSADALHILRYLKGETNTLKGCPVVVPVTPSPVVGGGGGGGGGGWGTGGNTVKQTPVPMYSAAPKAVISQFRIAENPADLQSSTWRAYTKNSVSHTFSDPKPGVKSIFVQFGDDKGNVIKVGGEDYLTESIELVASKQITVPETPVQEPATEVNNACIGNVCSCGDASIGDTRDPGKCSDCGGGWCNGGKCASCGSEKSTNLAPVINSGSCVVNTTECDCGNGNVKDPGKCDQCNGGWCKGNPASSKGGICASCSP